MPRKSVSRGSSPAGRAQSPAARTPTSASAQSRAVEPPCAPNEFFGVWGTGFITLSLPVVVIFLYYACPNRGEGPCLEGVNIFGLRYMTVPSLYMLVDAKAFTVILAWFAWLVFLERVLPGEVAEGVVLENGKRLKYRMNSHLSFWVTIFMLQQYAFANGAGVLVYLYDDFVQLAAAAIVLSTALSAGLYAASFRPGAMLAKGGRSGFFSYDFFMGRELNPRVGSFDWKVFCELRPGLIGWAVLDLAFMAKEREFKGANSNEMLLCVALQVPPRDPPSPRALSSAEGTRARLREGE